MTESIQHLLTQATQHLHAYSTSARLDAELLLCHVLSVSRAFLYSHPEKIL